MEDCGHIPEWTGQRVERTNARGRHRYCASFKTWIVEMALKPGMSMAGLAMRNQVNANQLRRWVLLHRVGAATVPATVQRLMPVSVTLQPAQAIGVNPAAFGIEIELPGAVVRVREGVDATTLRAVLGVLRESSR